MKFRSRLAATLAALLLLLASCTPAPASRPPNVVVIVLDTVRPDYLSAYGHERPTSPYLERFASEGTRFDRAWSSSSWTLPAHASLFSGTEPAFHRATQLTERIAPDVPLLAERLRDAGYQTLGLSNNMWISKATGLARGFEEFHDEWSFRQRLRTQGASHPSVLALRQWFERARKPDAPFFAFVNLTDAHMPYLPHWEEAQPFFADKAAWKRAIDELFPDMGMGLLLRQFAGGKPLDERELGELRALYEGCILRTDRIAEALLAEVDAHSDPRNTLVFVLSDHGENLGEHGLISHVFNLYESNVRIALLARGPGFGAGVVEEHQAQITDLYPTILHAAGLEAEPACSGLDLCGTLPERRTLVASLERPLVSLEVFPESVRKSGVLARFDRALNAVIGLEFKQITGSDGSHELFHVSEDPGELQALASLTPERRERYARVLAEYVRLQQERSSAEVHGDARQNPLSRGGLRELGYVGDDK